MYRYGPLVGVLVGLSTAEVDKRHAALRMEANSLAETASSRWITPVNPCRKLSV